MKKEKPLKPGTRVMLDHKAVPKSRRMFWTHESKRSEIEGVIERAANFDGVWKYSIKIAEGRTIFPVGRDKFEVIVEKSSKK